MTFEGVFHDLQRSGIKLGHGLNHLVYEGLEVTTEKVTNVHPHVWRVVRK